MKSDRQRDAEMDTLLGGVLRAAAPAQGADCPQAGDIAAFVEGNLQGAEHDRLELHFSTCEACQQALATIGRMLPAEDVRPVRAHRSWSLPGWGRRVLIPAGAAALLLVYLAVKPALEPARPDMQMARSIAPAGGIPAPADARRGAVSAPGTAPTELPGSPPKPQQRGHAGPPSRADRSVASAKPEHTKTAALKAEPGVSAQGSKVVPAAPMAEDQGRVRGGGAEKRVDAASRKEVALDQLVTLPPGAKPQTPAPPAPSALVPVAAAPPAQAPAGLAAVAAPPSAPPAGVAGTPPSPTFRAGAVAESVVVTAAAPVAQPVTRTAVLVTAPGGRVQWRLDRGAAISRSTDAGSSWQLQHLGATGDLLAGSSPDAATCWAVGRAGLVLLTTDGEHWEPRSFAEKVDLVGVNARDALTATVTVRDGRRFTTLDGGVTWQPER